MRKIVTILMLILCVNSHAQDSITAKEVIVTSKMQVKDKGFTKTVVDSAQLARSLSSSFAELLSLNTPIYVKTYGQGSLATVAFRDTAASHTQVLWNGVNVNNPMLGQVDFSSIPVWFVDKVELMHGGSSLVQNAGALGGSVIMGSLPNWDAKVYGTALQSFASFNKYKTFVKIGGGTQNFQVRAKYIYANAKNDFTFYNNAVLPYRYQKLQNADYIKHGANLDLFARFKGDNYLSVNGWFFYDKRNLPTIMSYEGPGRDEHEKSNEYRVSAKWSKYTNKIKSDLVVGYTNTALDYFLANQTMLGQVVNYDSRSKIQTIQAKYNFEYKFNENVFLKTGVNIQNSDVAILDHITDQGYKAARFDYGAVVSGHAKFLPWLSGFALLRYENDGQFMPSLGFQFDPLSCFAIKLNAARNFHKPTLNDLYWIPGGNPNLKPESGYTTDIAFAFNKFGLNAELTAYGSWIDDWIIWQPSEFRYWTATNLQKVFARGIEVNLKYGVKLGQFRVGASANYAFTRTSNMKSKHEDDLSVGKQLMYIPIHKANALAEVEFKWFKLAYWYSYTGERFTTSSNDNYRHTLPGYGLHNISLTASWKGIEIMGKIENLFDADYQAILWRPMPKRNFQITLNYSFLYK